MLLTNPSFFSAVLGSLMWFLTSGAVVAQDNNNSETQELAPRLEEALGIKFVKGPAKCPIGAIAEITIPEGCGFADGPATRKILESMQNPTGGNELGLIGPMSLDWFVVFEFSDVGYVKDDEKDALDADAMLQSLTEGNESANAERKRRGWSEISILGWEIRPRFNELTKNLEWATRASSEGTLSINKNTRYLGRRGVMETTLVASPERFRDADSSAMSILTGFQFTQENKYGSFRSGDKVAEIGLTALVTGGAAVAAIKLGFFKKFWKIIIVGVIAIVAGVKRIFFGKKESTANAS